MGEFTTLAAFQSHLRYLQLMRAQKINYLLIQLLPILFCAKCSYYVFVCVRVCVCVCV